MNTHKLFKNIPLDSKLIGFGNCARLNNGNWTITCVFKKPNGDAETVELSVEMLPALAIGRVYSQGKITLPQRQTLTVSLPKFSVWKLKKNLDYHCWVRTEVQSTEYDHQKLFFFQMGNYYVWLPSIELARALFLKTIESTRNAFYEPNLNSQINVEIDNTEATIRLDERYPKKLLDVKAHQKYLAWLMLNPQVLNSYLSMYQSKLNSKTLINGKEIWTFDFQPFEMENVFLNCFIQMRGKNIFIEEIASVANLPMTDDFNKVFIDHPLDIKVERESLGDGKQGGTIAIREVQNIVH